MLIKLIATATVAAIALNSASHAFAGAPALGTTSGRVYYSFTDQFARNKGAIEALKRGQAAQNKRFVLRTKGASKGVSRSIAKNRSTLAHRGDVARHARKRNNVKAVLSSKANKPVRVNNASTLAKRGKVAQQARRGKTAAAGTRLARTGNTAAAGSRLAHNGKTVSKGSRLARGAKGLKTVAKGTVVTAIVADITGADQLLVDAITDPTQSLANVTDPGKIDGYANSRIDYFEKNYVQGGHVKNAANWIDRKTGGHIGRAGRGAVKGLNKVTGGRFGKGAKLVGKQVKRTQRAGMGLVRATYNDTFGAVLQSDDMVTGARTAAANILKLKFAGNAAKALDQVTGGRLSKGARSLDRATGGRLGKATKTVSRSWNKGADYMTGGVGKDIGKAAVAATRTRLAKGIAGGARSGVKIIANTRLAKDVGGVAKKVAATKAARKIGGGVKKIARSAPARNVGRQLKKAGCGAKKFFGGKC